jgi:putative intracellular protease/amidase
MISRTWRRGLAVACASLALVVVGGWIYLTGFDLDRLPAANPQASHEEIDFLATPAPPRGRLLAVVTSAARIGDGRRRGGYELTELSRAYYTFKANGYEVDIASPAGGTPLVVIDDDDMTDVDFAFLNDPEAQRQVAETLRLDGVDPTAYEGVYFVGGKGAMVDFPDNPDIRRIIADIDARGGVIGAVCHGPAALLGARGADGRPLLAGRRVTAFTNDEELFLISDAHDVFGRLLQDRLIDAGALFAEGPMYLDNTVVDGRLVSGQNPWSTWSVAEAMIRALGHEPVPRKTSGEEHAVAVLAVYRRNGFDAARARRVDHADADARLILMHALVAAMRGELLDAWRLQRLAHRWPG